MDVRFESADLTVLHADRGSETVWVSWGSGNLQPWARAFLSRRGVTATFIVPHRIHAYQVPEIWEALAAVREVTTGAKRVVAYGSSMGSFGAMAFAREVNADAIIAASPLVSAHRDVTPFDTRYEVFPERWERADARDGLCGKLAVIYDPAAPIEAAHTAMLDCDIKIGVPGGGHDVLEPWRATRELGARIDGILHDMMPELGCR